MEEAWEFAVVSGEFDQEQIDEFISDNARLCRVFISQIDTRLQNAALFIRSYSSCFKNMPPDFTLLYSSIYSIATNAAQIGLILNPSTPRKYPNESSDAFSVRKQHSKIRGASIRSLLKVKPDHKILDRGLRNAFMHIDEDIDHWWLSNERKSFIMHFVGQMDIEGSEEELKQFYKGVFETFDPETQILIGRGQEYSINDIIHSLDDINNLIAKNVEQKFLPSRFIVK